MVGYGNLNRCARIPAQKFVALEYASIPKIISVVSFRGRGNHGAHRAFVAHATSADVMIYPETEWMKAVSVSQGINEAFSTGSQAQYPPHPSSVYAQ